MLTASQNETEQKNDGVKFRRDDYLHSLPDWMLVSDVCEGERAIKSRKEVYLPKPNAFDTSRENNSRYDAYVKRASFYNATGHTQQSYLGAVFRKPPEVNRPESLAVLDDNVDGGGVSLTQQSQSVYKAVIGKGRHALWVDYPTTDGQASVSDLESGRVRPNIVSISAESVINWRSDQIGGEHKLSLVVIEESYKEVKPDGFSTKTLTRYRVLRLLEGRYVVELWTSKSDGEKYELESTYVPSNGGGSAWTEIPFTFVGAANNDTDIDRPPLLDMATLNIAHYRNSADYEDSAFFCGQAQPWIAGLTADWRDHIEKQGLYVGSRAPITLPEGGSFGIAQAQPNTLVSEAMDKKERQMAAIGARLLEKGSAVKTATEAQGDNESEHSVLSLAAENVSNAYQKALTWAAEFLNVSGEIEFQLNTEFAAFQLDSQMLTALMAAWQSGALPSSDLWAKLRKAEIIDPEKDDDEVKEQLEAEAPDIELDDVNGK